MGIPKNYNEKKRGLNGLSSDVFTNGFHQFFSRIKY